METFWGKYGSSTGAQKERVMSEPEKKFRLLLKENIDILVAADVKRRETMNSWERPSWPATAENISAVWEREVANKYLDWQFEVPLQELEAAIKKALQ